MDLERSEEERRAWHAMVGRSPAHDDRLVIPTGLEKWRTHDEVTRRIADHRSPLISSANTRSTSSNPGTARLNSRLGPDTPKSHRRTPSPSPSYRSPRSPIRSAPPPTPPSKHVTPSRFTRTRADEELAGEGAGKGAGKGGGLHTATSRAASGLVGSGRTRTDEDVLRELVGEDMPLLLPRRKAEVEPESPTVPDYRGTEPSQILQRRGILGVAGSFLDVRSASASMSPHSPPARHANGTGDSTARLSIDSRATSSALFTAAAHGQVGMVRMLLGMGNAVDGRTGSSTPLHVACAEGHDLVVRELMKHGACASSTDAQGRTPLAVAKQSGHRACEAAILEHSNSLQLPQHRPEVVAPASAFTLGNNTGSEPSRHMSLSARAENTRADQEERVSSMLTQEAAASSAVDSAFQKEEEGTLEAGKMKTEQFLSSPVPAVSVYPRSSPFSHLLEGKARGENLPTPTVAQTASSAVSTDLFTEFDVTPPKATVRCLSRKPQNCPSHQVTSILPRLQLRRKSLPGSRLTSSEHTPQRLLSRASAAQPSEQAAFPKQQKLHEPPPAVSATFTDGPLGLTFICVAKDQPPRVRDVATGSQAYTRQGLVAGLTLVAVDGQSVRSRPYDFAIGLLASAQRPLTLDFESSDSYGDASVLTPDVPTGRSNSTVIKHSPSVLTPDVPTERSNSTVEKHSPKQSLNYRRCPRSPAPIPDASPASNRSAASLGNTAAAAMTSPHAVKTQLIDFTIETKPRTPPRRSSPQRQTAAPLPQVPEPEPEPGPSQSPQPRRASPGTSPRAQLAQSKRARVSPNRQPHAVTRQQVTTSPSSPRQSPQLRGPSPDTLSRVESLRSRRHLGVSPNRQPRAVKTQLIDFTIETKPRTTPPRLLSPQRQTAAALPPEPEPEAEPDPRAYHSGDSSADETSRQVKDAMEILLRGVEARVLGSHEKASAISATTFTCAGATVTHDCGEEEECFDEEMLRSVRILWSCTQHIVRTFGTDAVPETTADNDLEGMLLQARDDGSERLASQFDDTLEQDLCNLVTEKMEQFEAVRATIELKLGAGSTINSNISGQQLIRNQQRAARELPRKMEMLTMALFAHRLKISTLRQRISAAISRRAEIGRHAHQRAALYDKELARIREALVNLPSCFSAPKEGRTINFSRAAAESHGMLQQPSASVEQVFPQSLISVKVSSAHGRLAAEVARRCCAVLAAGERQLSSLHSAALAEAERAVATEGPLRAQIKLLDELHKMEAVARQVLMELRKGSTDADEVDKLKADEAAFAESLKQHLDEQKQVAALLL